MARRTLRTDIEEGEDYHLVYVSGHPKVGGNIHSEHFKELTRSAPWMNGVDVGRTALLSGASNTVVPWSSVG